MSKSTTTAATSSSSPSSSSSSSSFPIRVKWGKEIIDLNLIPSNGVGKLKSELEECTGVPCDRMKLMAKSKGLWKGVLKDDYDLTSIDFNNALSKNNKNNKNGAAAASGAPPAPLNLLLMGSATKLVGPKTKTIFIEDLPGEEVAKHTKEPSGLVNMGNTCYLNSVTQCLRAIPYFRSVLASYPYPTSLTTTTTTSMQQQYQQQQSQQQPQPHPLLLSLRDLYTNADRTINAITPTHFVMCVKMSFPQFAQTNPTNGQPMQQDAEEFYSNLLSAFSSELHGNQIAIQKAFESGGGSGSSGSGSGSGGTTTTTKQGEDALMGADNAIDAIFGLVMEETLTCDELGGGGGSGTAGGDYDDDDDAMKVDGGATGGGGGATAGMVEPPVKSSDLHRKLVCNIQGGVEQTTTAAGGRAHSNTIVNVNHIHEGIHLSLSGKIEKRSEILGRDSIWTRTQRITRLPPILTVQFGRFYWKLTPHSQDHSGVKCKVMKPVAFQSTLDVYEFCSKKIQSILKIYRDKARDDEEDAINKKLKSAAFGGGGGGGEEEATTTKNDAAAAADKKTKKDSSSTTKEEEKEEAMDTSLVDESTKVNEGMIVEDDEDAAALQAALKMSMEEEEEDFSPPPPPPVVGPGLPSNFMGIYELFAVVTHKGRDADGGHYMGWVKADNKQSKNTSNNNNNNNNNGKGKKEQEDEFNNNNEDDWFVFDDDEVSPWKTEDVLKLKGGGDWHMSYLNFYRAIGGSGRGGAGAGAGVSGGEMEGDGNNKI